MEAARNGVGSGKPGGRIWVGDNELLDAEIRGEIPEMQRALEIKLHNSQDTLLRLSNGTMVLFRLQIFITGHCSTFCLYLTNFVRSWTNWLKRFVS